ncbi:hypothetical protein Tco_0923111 [Tanacetum coccineum]|uniref:Uncharacterized protein n=1 Tax=Tanacetum coccineum TaxID=301880 RepID=A0ABQ5D1L1_9ASTR
MSFPSAHTVPKTTIPIDRAQDPPLITSFHDDPYVLVRQAYTPIATDTEFEPFEDPIETEETQQLSPRAAPLSPNYTLASPNYTPDTPHSDEESKPIEASETRIASPSDSTSPLSPDQPLTQTSPTPTPSRAFYYHRTTRMAVRTQPTLSPGLLARLTKAMALSPLSFCKRYRPSYETPTPSSSPPGLSPALPPRKIYRGTSELIADIESEDLEDESIDSESEETAYKDRQQAIPVKGITTDEPLGLGYGTDRRCALELAEDIARNTFEAGQSSRTTPSVRCISTYTSRGYGSDISELYDRLAAVRGKIHSQSFRVGSMEQGQEQDTITFGALWRPVLAFEAWAGETDAQRAALW